MDSDGEEIPFTILHSNLESSYENCHYTSESQQIEQYFSNDEKYSYKHQLPTGIVSENPYEIEKQNQLPFETSTKSQQGLFKIHPQRKKKFIQIQRRTKLKYIVCKKGNRRETSLLNINVKTLISNLLRQFMLFHNVIQYEQQKINDFFSSKANFKSFQKLYGVQNQQTNSNQKKQKKIITVREEHDNLRKFLLEKLETGEFISRIMKNKKMTFSNKISMMKFCSQIRNSCISPQKFNNWKMMGIY